MIRKIALLAVTTLLLMGCNDLFDTGDVEGELDMDPQVELKPLSNQTDLADGGTEVAVQLIAEQRSEDLSVEYSIDSESSSAEEGVHYEIETPSPVTIESGSNTTDIVISYIEDSVPEGEEVQLIINLDGTDADVEPAANLSTSTTFISN
ncbi:MAG: hypothetical protein WD511_00135 [Balneolaceae bacterium]